MSTTRTGRKRPDGYRIDAVAASPGSSESTWHRVRRPDGTIVATVSTRKAATDAIHKDKKRKGC